MSDTTDEMTAAAEAAARREPETIEEKLHECRAEATKGPWRFDGNSVWGEDENGTPIRVCVFPSGRANNQANAVLICEVVNALPNLIGPAPSTLVDDGTRDFEE